MLSPIVCQDKLFNRDLVRASLAKLVAPDQVFEMRLLSARRTQDYHPITLSGFFRGDQLPKLVYELGNVIEFQGAYWTPSELNPSLLARRAGRLDVAGKGDSCGDRDVIRRLWLLIDIDPVRPAGIASSDEEHEASLMLAKKVVHELWQVYGLPPGLLADSGNGAHIMLPCDLPNSEQATRFHEQLLIWLGRTYSTARIKIDSTTFNASRIWKMYGSYARKGEDAVELGRPWRMAHVLMDARAQATGQETPICAETIEQIARQLDFQISSTAPVLAAHASANGHARASYPLPSPDVARFLEIYRAEHREWEQVHAKSDGALVYQLVHCPFNESHIGSAVVLQLPNGAKAFTCRHDSCADKKWADFRGLYETVTARQQRPHFPAHQPRQTTNAADLRANPAAAAEEFLATLEHPDGLPMLVHWRGEWWQWRAGCYITRDAGEIKAQLIKFLNARSQSVTTKVVASAMMQLEAQSMVEGVMPAWRPPVDPAACWLPSEMLATPTELVHLPTLEEIPATPFYFTNATIDYAFQRGAQCPRWLSFLHQIWSEDDDCIRMLQEFFGYCLVADTSLQKILFLLGPRRSGKGTIARVLQGLVGHANFAGLSFPQMATNFGLQEVIGKRVVSLGDAHLPTHNKIEIVDRLLAISGEDHLQIDRKYRQPFNGKLAVKLMMAANELPKLAEVSGALAGRFVFLGMQESFYGRENPGLTEELFAERPGILLWALEGLARLRERGRAGSYGRFTEPTSSLVLQREFQDLVSPVGKFFRDCMVADPGSATPSQTIVDAYRAWSNSLHMADRESSVVMRDLRTVLASHGIHYRATRPRMGMARVQCISGVRMRTGGDGVE